MTPAVQDSPGTALDLLFGPVEDAPGALADQILSGGAEGNLYRALGNLPKVTREAAIHEVTTQAAALLDVDLIGLLVAGWRAHQDLTAAARHTLTAPGSTELVDLTTHQITTTQQPDVSVLIDGHRIAILKLGLSVVFDVSALVAGISAGRLIALHSGRCDITATLAIQGIDVVTRKAHFELPGVIPLRPGVRLLAARDYLAGAEQAKRPAADLAGRTPAAREETIQMLPIPHGPGIGALPPTGPPAALPAKPLHPGLS
jgi:hypothetical protein